MIIVRAVHIKVRQALVSLHKCLLWSEKKSSFTMSHPGVELWLQDLQFSVLANWPQTLVTLVSRWGCWFPDLWGFVAQLKKLTMMIIYKDCTFSSAKNLLCITFLCFNSSDCFHEKLLIWKYYDTHLKADSAWEGISCPISISFCTWLRLISVKEKYTVVIVYRGLPLPHTGEILGLLELNNWRL